jgi:hypothetical protein
MWPFETASMESLATSWRCNKGILIIHVSRLSKAILKRRTEIATGPGSK